MKYSQHILCLAVAFVAANSFAAIDQDIDLRDDCDGGCHPDSVYVDDASNPLGNGDFDDRYDTIAAGIARLGTASTIDSSYDVRTVCVDNGWYPEELLITADQSGTATQYNMVQAEFPVNLPNAVAVLADSNDPDLPVLPSGIATVDDLPAAYIQGGFRLDGSGSADAPEHIAIHGFAITDAVEAGGDEKGQAIRIEGPNSTAGDPVEEFYIIGNYIYHTIGPGVAIWGADWQDNPGNFNNIDGVVVRDNYFHNVLDGASNEKLHAAVGVRDVWFYKNTFLDDIELDITAGGECIDFKDGVKDSYIVGNDLTRCGWNDGVDSDGPSGSADTNRRTNIYIDGGRTAWNIDSGFVGQRETCSDNIGILSECPVYDNGTPTDYSDDVLNWPLDTVAENDNIEVSGNRLRDGTGNGISIATEGFGSNDNIRVFNNTVQHGAAGGIVVHDPARGLEANSMCAAASPSINCGRNLAVDVYNNTVSATPSDITFNGTTLEGKDNQKNFMFDTVHGYGDVRGNISANVAGGGEVSNAGHYKDSGNQPGVYAGTFLGDNMCDTTHTRADFCGTTGGPNYDSTMTLNTATLEPNNCSKAVDLGVSNAPLTDIDNVARSGSAPADAGAHEQEKSPGC